MKKALTLMKNTLQGVNNIVGEAENQISNIKGKEAEISNLESKKKNEFKKCGQYTAPLARLQVYQCLHHVGD